MKNLIVASTSTLYGQSYLEYILPEFGGLYGDVKEVVFIPFARPGGATHDQYTEFARKAFEKIDIAIKGVHSFSDPKSAVINAKGIFTGGGNTFVLVKQLLDLNLMEILSDSIKSGAPYLGTSAGSNICGINMRNTNDMPIVHPSSFNTLGILPFNINPHYLDPDPKINHMGETREQRIKEFHTHNNIPVVGLREGSWLRVQGEEIHLKGGLDARIFEANKSPYEIPSGTSLKRLS
ncbi:MAG: dipeptidase PepE [Bacteroidota bacterium]